MGFVIGLIIGVLAGGSIAYFLASKQASRQAAIVQDLQRQLDLSESEHERRLREATDQLRRDYAAPAPAPAVSPAPAPAAVSPPASVATPVEPPTASVATSPQRAETPVTATVPTPLPQPVMQSPTVPEGPASASSSSAPTSDLRVADPNAVLAASYAPDAATRYQVATAIAEILPQAGMQSQARWLPVLGRLTRDTDATVRLAAIEALEPVSPAKRLPWLQRALKDTDPAVVAAANALINTTKGHTRRSQPSKKRRLPKNK
ncbi:HEAT repeat domain-containing protein [Leptolyngbya iicbica]|uniref:HEAT repeat domain-containing protein n=2 Tax=Cyanophyceae TaxID=3028117 RepID=A0A4V2E2U2_9CYAN|nr:HEAT repeat domain-containing protein [Leptolyngbya sp. LK]RZM79746.1 hypothetical protein DYY88_13730 [Leptolyngbya sp. LK]